MDGAHDLGGMHGFGPIDRSQTVHFAEAWEEDVFRLVLGSGMQGLWNLDQSRFARETMEPSHYLSSSYYEHWLHGLEVLLVAHGVATADELESGRAEAPAAFTPVPKAQVPTLLARGGPVNLDTDAAPLYQVGNRVTIANRHPKGHTRMPRYARGRTGEIVIHHGAHIFPDQHAVDGEKIPAHLYTVRFDGAELWGDDCAEPNSTVMVDVFEPYIEGRP